MILLKYIPKEKFQSSPKSSLEYSNQYQKIFVHPFDDPDVIDGQATIGYEQG